MVWPAIISAGASLLGSLFGERGKEKEIQLQKDFAQQGIRWKVDDAKAAGIHPLYALGASTHSYAPVGVGSSLQQGLSDAGQHIGRAMEAKATNPERVSNRLMELQLQRGELENALLASQIRRINQPGHPPAMPSQDMSPFVAAPVGAVQRAPLASSVPLEVTGGMSRAVEPASISDLGWSKSVTPSGTLYAPVPSRDVAERIEDNIPAQFGWGVRNQLTPMVKGGYPGPWKAPAGHQWVFDWFDQGYYLVGPKGDIIKNPVPPPGF